MVSHVDILPTVMEAVELDCPPVAGQSLLPLAKGEEVAWREYLFAEWCSGGVLTYFPQRSVRDERFKLISTLLQDRPSPSALGYAAPDQRWEPGATLNEIARADEGVRRAYEIYMNPPPEELYDLENDPWEFKNLADDPEFADVQTRLREVLRAWQEETQDVLLDPACLEKLTREHDAIRDEHYGDNPWGRSRDFEWQYTEYLYQGTMKK
jgi:N-sulfoglucosamine sulfohydrolase